MNRPDIRIPIGKIESDGTISPMPPPHHVHPIADVTGLAQELGKAETFRAFHLRRMEHLESGLKGLVISQSITGLALAALVLHALGVF